ncbi:zinc-ribbon domain-containing protein [Streptomyces naphthomycinicus]|uniref:zinc-ribbon domain-containing protein n=1 Tax=Streptomyces naphthomycinicus TaxID=2872625 RepID=UPI001CED5D03|nr:zinc-ribbon domain-containing protein [Streptomyces sp. TML10]
MKRRTVTAGNLDEILQLTEPAPEQQQEPAAAPPVAAPPPREEGGLRTEFEFELPRGYVDEAGTVHRHGSMRLATARDELRPQIDLRVKENPAYLSVVLLSQVITRIGAITDVHAGIVERMYATDVAFLQDFYRRVNSEGHTRAAVTCPHCEGGFEVDLSGGRLGES